jgi:hypothetical protein
VSTNLEDRSGCDVCRRAVYSKGPELEQIAADPVQPDFLYRCRSCEAYWEFNLHDGRPIAREEAMRRFPHAFTAAQRGGAL